MRSMSDVFAALIPPAVVATVFCTFIYKLLRREMAPRTSDGRSVHDPDVARSTDATSTETTDAPRTDPGVVKEDGAKDAAASVSEVRGGGDGSDNH
ncbi:hypothetical protein GCM10022402_49770 [Salinactinospora qingdaonensis]|uniref:Secreted protein n=1 Tax=Salinactinospora qingdaonensis TaxID=702744 RepID=A0ABP7GLM7_9ACTN